jgi:hypothetical protein
MGSSTNALLVIISELLKINSREEWGFLLKKITSSVVHISHTVMEYLIGNQNKLKKSKLCLHIQS